MLVRDHKLFTDAGDPVPYREAYCKSGKLVAPRFLIIHWTGGSSFDNAVTWLTRKPKPKSESKGSSAHVVIGRGGEIAQLVPFDVRAWHVGVSKYDAVTREGVPHTYEHMNNDAIGLELVNVGGLHRTAVGYAVPSTGKPVGGDDVVIAEHKLGSHHKAWQAYTEEQIAAAYEVCEALIDAYPSIEDVLGHDDVAWPRGRKPDPGPAFPMAQFRGWLFGRGEG